MKKTILIMVNHNITIYKFRKELVQRLVQEKYRVVVALPVTEETSEITDLGCEVIDIPVERRGTNPIKDLSLLLKYCKVLKNIKPDVVLTYTIKPNVYGGMACRLSRIPYISTITGLGSAIEDGGLLKHISLFLYRVGLKKATAIVYQNEANRASLEKAGISKKQGVLVSGSGVNLVQHNCLTFPQEENPVEFLFVARIMKTKGIDEFLQMSKEIKDEHPDTCFHILGFCEDDYELKLKEYTKQGIVIYHGMQQDIKPFMERVQCLIHPSYHEGMSNVCMEAAASGRAVIASDIPGCKEIVEDGKTGYLVEVQDAEALKKAVEKFLTLSYDTRKNLGINGRKKMEQQFDRQEIVNEYMKLIESIF